MAQWVYIKGCAKDFEGAPDWAAYRVNICGIDHFTESVGSYPKSIPCNGGQPFRPIVRSVDVLNGLIAHRVDAASHRGEDQQQTIGVKSDGGKLRMSLMPVAALNEILSVLEFGAQKYAPDNWRKVDNARERYYNAAHRHLSAWWGGERNDPESGLHHLAHCACCVIFLLATELENK